MRQKRCREGSEPSSTRPEDEFGIQVRARSGLLWIKDGAERHFSNFQSEIGDSRRLALLLTARLHASEWPGVVMPSAPPWLEECGSEGGVANNSRRVVDQDPGRATRDTSVAGDTEPEAMTGVAYLSLGARIVGSTLKGA
jgi:hypothetical protein